MSLPELEQHPHREYLTSVGLAYSTLTAEQEQAAQRKAERSAR